MNEKAEAVEYAMKTMELEGFSFSADEKNILKKVARGEMTTEEVRESAINKMTVREV